MNQFYNSKEWKRLKEKKLQSSQLELIKRAKSPVTWISIVALVYITYLQPKYSLPDWTELIGYLAIIFGIANNPTSADRF